jgi:hypothetical protein
VLVENTYSICSLDGTEKDLIYFQALKKLQRFLKKDIAAGIKTDLRDVNSA